MFGPVTTADLGPHHCFMRSGSVKHVHSSSRDTLKSREITKSALLVAVAVELIVSIHSYAVSSCAVTTVADYCATRTIQPTPNLSATMPNFGEKKVLVSGIWTWPPSDSAAKVLSASASLFAVIDNEKPLKSGLPDAMPSEAITNASPTLNAACMILLSSDGAQFGFFSGLSLKRIIISTLAPSAFL